MSSSTIALLVGILTFLILSAPYFLKSSEKKRLALEKRLFLPEERVEKMLEAIVCSDTRYGKFFKAHLYPYFGTKQPFVDKLTKILGFDLEMWREKIREAKLEKTITPEEMFSMKILGYAGLLFFGVAGLVFNMNLILIVMGLLSYVAGSMFPQSFVNNKLAMKRADIEYELPDFLDLLQSVVEAGLSIQTAIEKVSFRMKGVLAEEFRLVMVETKNGGRWEQAMENMSFRNNVDVLSDTISDILIAYNKGTPIAEVLEKEVHLMRQVKNARIQEKAKGLSVKLMLPVALFCFIPLVVLILGPMIIQVMEGLS